jgi:hypothetical protein
MTLVTVVGNVNADIVARPLLELPPPGGDLLVDTIEVRVGGAAANAGMALAPPGPGTQGHWGRRRRLPGPLRHGLTPGHKAGPRRPRPA